MNIILKAIDINKSYPGVKALDNFNFELYKGEVHALVGQNGAGKSTFIEIIAGSLHPDSGKIIIEDNEYNYLEPYQSIELGIQTIHQETQLVNELSIAENIFLFDLPTNKLGLVNYPVCRKRAKNLLENLSIDLNPDLKVEKLSFIEKKLTSIAKALSRQAKILILDEPTASLDEKGKEILFGVIRENIKKGLSVIYISHNLGEIFEISSRVTVLKDGMKIATHNTADIDMNTIVSEMIGRKAATIYVRDKKIQNIDRSTKLEVLHYSRGKVVKDVSFDIYKGEIFGLGGLVGSGRTELARMMFGLDEKDSGKLLYAGKDITPDNPYDAIQKGIGYLTEDRKEDGLLLERPIYENISLVRLAKSNKYILDLIEELNETKKIAEEIEIKTQSIENIVLTLSGGNQQKVVIAKWLYAGAEILIFDEPTVGVDVGAKGEIYRMIENLAKQGKIIIMISSDNPELIMMCDKVGVMKEGELVTILQGNDINEKNILRYSMGIIGEGVIGNG